MLKFQSRLYACISLLFIWKRTKTKRGKRVTLTKERKRLGTRNGMKIFYECVAIIFLQHKTARCYTLYGQCWSVFMSVVAFYSEHNHHTYDMTREFFPLSNVVSLKRVFIEKEDCRRARLTPSTTGSFQIKQNRYLSTISVSKYEKQLFSCSLEAAT